MNNEPPYIEVEIRYTESRYNPKYGDDRYCQCGHQYYRHFDTYEDMLNVGCKYCWKGCDGFVEAEQFTLLPRGYFDAQKSLL